MTSVLLVDRDRHLSETLREVLYEAGCTLMACPDASAALRFLQRAPRPVVVLLVHGGPHSDWERVLAAVPNLPPHAYLLLSTAPDKAPAQWNPHAQSLVRVISMPFDLDWFLAQIIEAIQHVQTPPPHTSTHN
jgi:DNA-binding NtrC family response regulator